MFNFMDSLYLNQGFFFHRYLVHSLCIEKATSQMYSVLKEYLQIIYDSDSSYWDLGFKSETQSWVIENRCESKT